MPGLQAPPHWTVIVLVTLNVDVDMYVVAIAVIEFVPTQLPACAQGTDMVDTTGHTLVVTTTLVCEEIPSQKEVAWNGPKSQERKKGNFWTG